MSTGLTAARETMPTSKVMTPSRPKVTPVARRVINQNSTNPGNRKRMLYLNMNPMPTAMPSSTHGPSAARRDVRAESRAAHPAQAESIQKARNGESMVISCATPANTGVSVTMAAASNPARQSPVIRLANPAAASIVTAAKAAAGRRTDHSLDPNTLREARMTIATPGPLVA
jgi:hypothetical protein